MAEVTSVERPGIRQLAHYARQLPVSKDPNDQPVAVNAFYPRWIETGKSEPCTCSQTVDARGNITARPLNCPRCHGTWFVPRRMIVRDHKHHSAIVGYEVDEKGEKVRPKPPTVEEVMKAGYPQEVAEKIAQKEAYNALQGYEPYGDKPVPKPAAPEPVAAVPKEQQRQPPGDDLVRFDGAEATTTEF